MCVCVCVCVCTQAGYAGVATFSRVAPLSVEKELKGAKEHHGEGRVLVTEYKDFYMVRDVLYAMLHRHTLAVHSRFARAILLSIR